jgi:hypothetical protein
MAFTRIRTINGKQYLYEEHRYREGGKVKSRSVYLGPAGGSARTGRGGGVGGAPAPRRWYQPIPDEERGVVYIDKLVEKYPGDPVVTKAAEMKAAATPATAEMASLAERSPSPETAPDAAPSAPSEESE